MILIISTDSIIITFILNLVYVMTTIIVSFFDSYWKYDPNNYCNIKVRLKIKHYENMSQNINYILMANTMYIIGQFSQIDIFKFFSQI